MKFRPAFARKAAMVAVVAVITMLCMVGLIWFLKSHGVDLSSSSAILFLVLSGGVIGSLTAVTYAHFTRMADKAAREEFLPDDVFG